MNLPSTFRLLDLSTAHVPKHTGIALGLSKDCSNAALAKELVYESWAEYGWIIQVTTELPVVAKEHPELQALLEHCAKHEISYLKLDCDAPTLDGFPVFTW